MNISKRIYDICECIEFESLGDIGTDHCYLPIAAIQGGFVKKAIGIDVNKGPLEIALSNIKEAGFSHLIELRLGSGLKPLRPKEVQTVVISGMGGILINSIIEESLEVALSSKQLILSPQSDVHLVRRNLHTLGFSIYGEKMVSDTGKFYNIIMAKPGQNEEYTDFEYEFGKMLLENPSEIFLLFMKKTLNFYENLLDKLKTSDNIESKKKRESISEKYRFISEYLESADR